ncbi:Uncharacterized protein APZ42_003223, partial [Daphnia magna]
GQSFFSEQPDDPPLHARYRPQDGRQGQQRQGRTDRPGEEGRRVAAGQRQAAQQVLVEQFAQHEAEDQRRHREVQQAHAEADHAEGQHDVDVEHPRRDGERADGAEHEDDRHQLFPRHQQDPEQRAHQRQAEEQLH